jgi:hypothetical protein
MPCDENGIPSRAASYLPMRTTTAQPACRRLGTPPRARLKMHADLGRRPWARRPFPVPSLPSPRHVHSASADLLAHVGCQSALSRPRRTAETLAARR